MCTSNNKDLSFAGNDPGASKFGNFINYYSFHSPGERINNLNSKMFPNEETEEILCLDIGCNTGDLTIELYAYLETIYPKSTIKMLAIDIDPILIKRAQEKYQLKHVSFLPCDVTTSNGFEIIKKYLQDEKKNMFNIIFCFSVTMWIHINNGDAGFKKFLKFLKDNSRTLIIESQPWKCYKNAQRRMKKSGKNFELYDSLNIRDNVDIVIEEIISDSHVKVYESPSSSWDRKIQSYLIK